MRVRLALDVDGSLTTLSERSVYSEQDRLRFLGRLKSDLPRLMPWLQPLTRKEVPVRLDALISSERSPELKRELVSLRSMVAVPAE